MPGTVIQPWLLNKLRKGGIRKGLPFSPQGLSVLLTGSSLLVSPASWQTANRLV